MQPALVLNFILARNAARLLFCIVFSTTLSMYKIKRELKSKASPSSSFYKPDRESKILRSIIKSNIDGLLPDSKIRAIYKELISGCLSLEEILKIAYLGPEGTHSEAAVHNQFGSQVVKIPSRTIDDVFFQLMHDEVNIGVVPVENSSEGVINTTLNCLADSEDINIIGENIRKFLQKRKHTILRSL